MAWLQIGYGPVGQVAAALLGRAGHDVAVFERHESMYGLPRAGHIDHEITRVFQGVGAASFILQDAFRCSTYGWRNQHGDRLIDIDWSQEGVSGWASDYLIYQPYLENALDAAARRHPTVSIHQGWEAVEDSAPCRFRGSNLRTRSNKPAGAVEFRRAPYCARPLFNRCRWS